MVFPPGKRALIGTYRRPSRLTGREGLLRGQLTWSLPSSRRPIAFAPMRGPRSQVSNYSGEFVIQQMREAGVL